MKPTVTTISNAPFDAVAQNYDTTFTETQLGRWLRQQVQTRLQALFQPGQTVLELGCGTGEDARFLAQKGIHVTATDQSQRMLNLVAQKTQRLGARVRLRQLDINHPQPWKQTFKGLFANFGVLNCAQDLRSLARFAAQMLAPGSPALFVVMNRVCPWEIVYHAGRGRFKQAFRRLGKSPKRVSLSGSAGVPVRYPGPGSVAKAFAPEFQLSCVRGLGVLLPPPYLSERVDKHPALFAKLKTIDEKIARYFPCTLLNDHYIIELTRS